MEGLEEQHRESGQEVSGVTDARGLTGNNLDNYDKELILMLQVRQVISLVTSHPYLPFCRHIIPILNFISIENIFGCYFFC